VSGLLDRCRKCGWAGVAEHGTVSRCPQCHGRIVARKGVQSMRTHKFCPCGQRCRHELCAECAHRQRYERNKPTWYGRVGDRLPVETELHGLPLLTLADTQGDVLAERARRVTIYQEWVAKYGRLDQLAALAEDAKKEGTECLSWEGRSGSASASARPRGMCG
jgi:hypothetical protein